jgi:excisionase family DNA binding protein
MFEQMAVSDLRDRPEMLSTADAARRLGVHPSRVRALLAAGTLTGSRSGEHWLIDATSVRDRIEGGVAPGRHLEPANAWAALALASGAPAAWLTPDARWRLRSLLDRRGVLGLAPRLRGRAQRERYPVDPGVLGQLSREPALVLTGMSAAAAHGLDNLEGDDLALDAYLASGDLDGLIRAYALEAASADGNVSLRVVDAGVWPPLEGRAFAPLAAVLLDLAEDGDCPTRARVGREALAMLDEQGRWRALSKG